MTADFEIKMVINGNKDELKCIIGLLKKYEEKQFDAYLESTTLKINGQSIMLCSLKDEVEIQEKLQNSDQIEIEAGGPYGKYARVAEVKFFEKLADVAPNAEFTGTIEGDTTYSGEVIKCELKDGILHLESFYGDSFEEEEAYENLLREKMPYNRFVELLKIDEEEYEYDEYDDYILESCENEYFMREDYEEFMELCPASGINEDEYEMIKEQLTEEGLDLDTFEESFEAGTTTECTYNPIEGKYV